MLWVIDDRITSCGHRPLPSFLRIALLWVFRHLIICVRKLLDGSWIVILGIPRLHRLTATEGIGITFGECAACLAG